MWILLDCDDVFEDRWYLEFSPIKLLGKIIIKFSYKLYWGSFIVYLTADHFLSEEFSGNRFRCLQMYHMENTVH